MKKAYYKLAKKLHPDANKVCWSANKLRNSPQLTHLITPSHLRVSTYTSHGQEAITFSLVLW